MKSLLSLFIFSSFLVFVFDPFSTTKPKKYTYKNIEISVCKILINKLQFCKGRMTNKIHICQW